ncbi:B-cell receptor-associated protein 31-like [Macadamia integrifolia]|uniref:B-cell receptor-associated protein 31-like n=1 Tax=Macadamia integrifolia TaxID=60698 RepID=UPI001C4EA7F4|nr:B-cell receptor-associated protein 31-like [Macadamia integrifolia]
MIQLLFLVLFAEGVIAFLLMVKIGPLREMVMRSLDQLKTGKGPATVKTIAGTMSVILASSVTSILKIQNKGSKLGTVTPMDQVLWRTHLLEASLIGYSLFLGFVIDRLHHYLQKLNGLRTAVGASKQEVEKIRKEHQHLKEKEEKASKEIKLLQEEISNFSENVKKLKLECEEREKKVLSSEAQVTALRKQSEDLLLEYDRLLEDNQHLQNEVLGYRS